MRTYYLIFICNENDKARSYNTYDVMGNRLTKTENGATTNYTYNKANQLTALGSTAWTYDGNGNLTSDGKLLRKVNPFRYASYFYDEETGLYYLMSRYYNAYIGRFLTRDVIQNKNLYVYGENSPINYVDPSGQFIVPILIWIGEFLASEAALLATTTVGSSIIAMDIKDNYTAARDFYDSPSWVTGAYLGINFVPGHGDDFAKSSKQIKNVYNSIKHAPKYPSLFKAVQNGPRR